MLETCLEGVWLPQCSYAELFVFRFAGCQSDFFLSSEVAAGNVHSGAPPPWLDAADGNLFNDQMELARGNIDFPTKGSGKSRKLNPKRVGAAWAERRKMELEREKRGEVIEDDCDANWLPNFGRVWQSGSRKESRKEFENEKQKLLKHESSSEMPLEIQPYVSKRMVSIIYL